MRTSFYLGRESLPVASSWRLVQGALLRLFIWQRRNELDATAHFGIPANQVVEWAPGSKSSPITDTLPYRASVGVPASAIDQLSHLRLMRR